MSLVRLAAPAPAGDDPPTEFRLFAAGVNRSTKGDVLFDDAAAAAVMARYERDGVDLMVDLEHGALDAPIREDSADARGWFALALRDGELWAVDVRWTPDGERRLRERRQRYISPAFDVDSGGRVTYLFNAALTSTPATLRAPPLMAASKLAPHARGRAYVASRRMYSGPR